MYLFVAFIKRKPEEASYDSTNSIEALFNIGFCDKTEYYRGAGNYNGQRVLSVS